MKTLTLFTCILIATVTVCGQTEPGRSALPESQVNYKLSGTRHGVSFFTDVKLPQVQYEHGQELAFDKYHSLDVIYYWLEKWSDTYKDLVELYEVGKSFEGRPIMQLTITNKKTGKDTDKPAAFFEGGRHSGEVTGSESVLWLIKYLLENYGTDPDVTNLLDTKAIYIKPVNKASK